MHNDYWRISDSEFNEQKSNSNNGTKASDSESDSIANTWSWKSSEVIHRSSSARHLRAPINAGRKSTQCPKIVNILLNHEIHHPRVMVPKSLPKGTLFFTSNSARYRPGTLTSSTMITHFKMTECSKNNYHRHRQSTSFLSL